MDLEMEQLHGWFRSDRRRAYGWCCVDRVETSGSSRNSGIVAFTAELAENAKSAPHIRLAPRYVIRSVEWGLARIPFPIETSISVPSPLVQFTRRIATLGRTPGASEPTSAFCARSAVS